LGRRRLLCDEIQAVGHPGGSGPIDHARTVLQPSAVCLAAKEKAA
jgi:hypothetical protein